jgi:hypothetical protein
MIDRMNPYDYYGDYLEEHTGVERENVGIYKKGGMPSRTKGRGYYRSTKSGAGMTQKGVEAYRRKNPGSKLKTAVTEDKPGPKRAARRKSYCARSAGQMKMHNVNCSKTPDKRICAARRRWKC